MARRIHDENGRVTGLRLHSNELSGVIPTELGNLANLQTLSLSRNALSGAIPSELGNLSNLEELYLNDNTLSGAIPAELGDLANLQILSLQRNTLSGAIPAELGNLSSLQKLYLHGNTLSGAIPAELANLTQLQALDIRNTGLCVTADSDLHTWTETIEDFQGANTCWNFAANANYRILTRYGVTTEIELADYLDPGVTGITFTLASCDSLRADYYDAVRVASGKLVLESNTARPRSRSKHTARYRLHRNGDGWGHNPRSGIPPVHRF